MLSKLIAPKYASLVLHIIYFVIGVFGLFGVCFLAFGLLSPPEHVGEYNAVFEAEKEEIWEIITDIEGLANRREDVVIVNVTSRDAIGPLTWDVLFVDEDILYYKRVNFIIGENFSIDFVKNNNKLMGRWTYRLIDLRNGRVRFSLKEKSYIDSWYERSLSLFFERNRHIKAELESVLQKF